MPFVMTSNSQFRVDPPPDLTSALYATDVSEIHDIGGAVSAVRTAEQTERARFYADDNMAHWNRIATSVLQSNPRSLVQTARLFALLHIAAMDAVLTCWDGKYQYKRWRPYYAITLADTDGNAATTADATWTSLIGTPNHPEYPSAHSFASGAAATVLISEFGDQVTFSHTSLTLPGVTHTNTSFSSVASETADSRVLGGIHFRNTVNISLHRGAEVAQFVLASVLRPLDDEGEDE